METFRFEVEPANRPDVKDLIETFSFDLFKRQIRMTMKENVAMDAYRWLVSIKDIYDKAGLFPNLLAQDMIALHYYNGEQKFATIRFARLLVENHTCDMAHEMFDTIKHHVVIGFEKQEIDA